MPTTQQRKTANLPPELAADLDRLAEVRFGGSTSAAIRAAVEAALVIYDEPATYRAASGGEAVEAFVQARAGKRGKAA